MDLFLPAEQRREILKQYGQDYGLDVFIETGTNEGQTPWALKDLFRCLFTIELSDDLFHYAVSMFRPYPHVTCLHGDSSVVLPQVLAMIDAPALVWLDGHYSGPGTAHGTLSTPIEKELTILFTDERAHVILVDDARIFKGEAEHDLHDHYTDYPSLQWIEDLAHDHDYDYLMKDDIVRLTPRGPA